MRFMKLRSHVRSRLAGFARAFRALSPRNQLLCAVWTAFVLLVAVGIHGSSSGAAAAYWMPEKPFTGTLLQKMPIPAVVKAKYSTTDIKKALLEMPRVIRWDECYGGTPFALSQLVQSPRFPVVNKSIGADGQNMLVTQHAPVWHLASLGRPVTWGYFFLGARRGLAWSWWFQTFACFTALTLLLEIVLRGQWKLAAFGAFLYSSSAYVICWSQWPAYETMFAAVVCLTAYHLLTSRRPAVLVTSAILFGMASAGFATDLYPPWQVPTGHLFLCLFVALIVRDRVLVDIPEPRRLRLALSAVAVLVCGVIVFAWWRACAADLRVMAQTSYPGHRVSHGGDLTFASLFRGTYNLFTIFEKYKPLKNESEASSFYYFFPAVFALLCFSREVRRRFGPVGWILTGYIVVMLVFLLVGLPVIVAKALFLSYSPARSADIGLGVASIILTVHTLAVVRDVRLSGDPLVGRGRRFVAPAVAVVVLVIFLAHAYAHHKLLGNVPSVGFAIFMSALMAGLSWALAAGRVRLFAVSLALLQVLTSFWFNPIATNLDHIYESELAHAIRSVKARSGEPSSLWAVFGGTHVGVLIEMLGDRAVTGIQWPPQLHGWSVLDPKGEHFVNYNRYADITFLASKKAKSIIFRNPVEGALTVTMAPNDPHLRQLGVRYVVLMGDQQSQADETKLRCVLRSQHLNFSIYEFR
jgi:hypothetical protein